MTIYIPDDDELDENLSATKSMDERRRYVRSLLVDAALEKRAQENYERRIADLEDSKANMAQELRVLRQKYGDLSPEERSAADQRYDMLGKLTRARHELTTLKRELRASLDRMEAVLAK